MRKIKWPKVGEYVLVTAWGDKDPNDPWYVGFVSEISITKRGIYYRVEGSNRYFKHIFRISKDEGVEWLKTFAQQM